MPTAFRAIFACAVSLTALSGPLRAHDGDGKVRDRRPRIEVGGGRSGGGGSSQIPIFSEDFQFPRNNVQLLSWVTLRDIGPHHDNGNSITGYVSPSGREYAVLGTSRGSVFVDITDPGNPTILTTIAGPLSLWRDLKTYQHYIYAVSEGGDGIQVIDVAQIDAGSVTLVNTILTGGSEATHTVALDATSGFLYRCGGSGLGLRIYDLANPVNPSFVTTWNDRYVHECQAVTYTSGPYAGKQVVFACGGLNGGFQDTALDILDVTNKSAIVLMKRFRYSGAAYSHQGWLTPDRQYFYLDDELDDTGALPMRTRVIDVSNLSNPVERPGFTTGSTAIDHNLYVLGNRIYESNYRSGLHVFDNSNPLLPVEVASFDTFPEDDAAHFNGLWNNYPFLPSGVVIGSDIERGLFVWRIGAPTLDFTIAGGAPTLLNPAGQSVSVQVVEATSGVLAAGSAKFHSSSGAAWTSVDLVPTSGTSFTIPFPALACGSDLAWYLTARTTTNETWSFPQGAPNLVEHATVASALSTYLFDKFESPSGWTLGSPTDTATEGLWTRADPNGTYAQSADDHSLLGQSCWFTGQAGSLEGLSANDVDGGATTLTSPAYDLTALNEPVISYWRWYSNQLGSAPNEDVFDVHVSNDDGATWSLVERVGPTGVGTTGGWVLHQFRLRDFVTPTIGVRLRFTASDLGNVSIVEAAIDDLVIGDVTCPPPIVSTYCAAKLNSQGCLPAIGGSGVPSVSGPMPFVVAATNILSNKAGLLFYGHNRASTPFQGGTLCVASPTRRTPVQLSGGNFPPVDCSGVLQIDMNAWIQGGADPLLVPGVLVDGQFWYRDPLDSTGFGSGLSNAIEFTVQP